MVENRMDELISKKWLLECVNECWIKFDTERDKNIFIHLIRDIAPTVPSTLYGYNIDYLKAIAITMQRNNLTPQEANYILNDIHCVAEMINEEYENMLKRSMETIFGIIGEKEN